MIDLFVENQYNIFLTAYLLSLPLVAFFIVFWTVNPPAVALTCQTTLSNLEPI